MASWSYNQQSEETRRGTESRGGDISSYRPRDNVHPDRISYRTGPDRCCSWPDIISCDRLHEIMSGFKAAAGHYFVADIISCETGRAHKILYRAGSGPPKIIAGSGRADRDFNRAAPGWVQKCRPDLTSTVRTHPHAVAGMSLMFHCVYVLLPCLCIVA